MKGEIIMKFTVNGKEYEGAKYNYNTSCEFEEMGVSIAELGRKPQSVMRAYLAISGGMDLDDAGNEIEQHLINGGTLTDIQNAFAKELSDSGFFKSLLNLTKEDEAQEKKKK